MENADILQAIRAEIERRIKENESWKDFHRSKGETTNFDDVKIVELQSILSFLSTLESEKPLGLEEEIERKYTNDTTTLRTRSQYSELARYFYDLGCRRTAEKYDEIEYNRQKAEERLADARKTSSNGLEEAANNYLDGVYGKMPHSDYHIAIFIAGAKWQKEQMMKEAVDADVELILHDKTGDVRLHTGYLPKELGIKCDDKVRVIIVKED